MAKIKKSIRIDEKYLSLVKEGGLTVSKLVAHALANTYDVKEQDTTKDIENLCSFVKEVHKRYSHLTCLLDDAQPDEVESHLERKDVKFGILLSQIIAELDTLLLLLL